MVHFYSFGPSQIAALLSTSAVLCIVYLLVLWCLLYIIYTFLYKAQFYRITGVTLFYALTTSAALLRICGYLDILLSNKQASDNVQQIYWQVNTLATMFMIAVGFQVSKNMFELAILLQPETDERESKLKTLNISAYVAFGIVFMIEIYLSIETASSSNKTAADLQDLSFKRRTYSVLLFVYLFVTLILVAGFIYMSKVFSQFKSAMVNQQKTMIQRLFFTAIMSYILASLFYSMSLANKNFIPSLFARDYIGIWSWPVFDLPVILSILWLHYRSFGRQVRDGHSIVDYSMLNNQRKVWTSYTTMQEQMMQLEIQAGSLESRPDISQFYMPSQRAKTNAGTQKLVLAQKPYYQTVSRDIGDSPLQSSADPLSQTPKNSSSNEPSGVRSSDSKLTDYRVSAGRTSLNSDEHSLSQQTSRVDSSMMRKQDKRLSEFANIVFEFRNSVNQPNNSTGTL